MSRKICIALLMQAVVGVAFAAEKDCSAVTCPSIPKHYEELSCEPVISDGECCANSYKCPDLTARNNSLCYYKNEVVKPQEYLKSTALHGICSAACYCAKGRENKPAEFQCAHIDCPEFFGHEPKKNCVRQHHKDHCCSIKTVCDDEVEKLATCVFEGETYREGQAMYPDETCYKCFCSKNFDNSTAMEYNKDCHKIECGVSLRYVGRIAEGCIPVYYKRDNCCPIGWRCPGDKHMKENESAKKSDLGPKCKFGKMEFSIGESLDVNEKCQKCSCITPPMLHCIQTC